jgi:peptidoglycan/xylan/chitin deacetylase (PgdA/CDA1 family)
MDQPPTARRVARRIRSVVADRAKRTVKLAVSAGLFAADQVAGAALPSCRRGRRSTGVVLMYHDVAARHRARFARQCDEIVRLAEPAALSDFPARPDGAWRVAVTFDDGFRSFAQVALPELDRCGIPSTMFVPTEWSRRSEARPDDGIASLALVEHDGSPVPMTPSELAQLPASVELGSHSRTHAHLPTLDDDTLLRELAGSRDELHSIAGTAVRYHAFPYGEHDPRVVATARDAGYERCYGIAPSDVRPTTGYVVGRVQADPTDWPVEFRLKVLGAYRWMSWWMTAKDRVRSRASTGATS